MVGIVALATVWSLGVGIERLSETRENKSEELVSSTKESKTSQPTVKDEVATVDTVLGASEAEVRKLLDRWRESNNSSGPGLRNYELDVKLVVKYENGIAVGAAVLSIHNRHISEKRAAELASMIGDVPDDFEIYDGKIYGFYIGDI